MVELTMALFTKFWVNGKQDELLSLLDGNSPVVKPDAVANDFAGKTVVLVAFSVSGRSHGSCLFWGLAWTVREHHRRHYVMSWKRGATT
jgi:hypothetical protein